MLPMLVARLRGLEPDSEPWSLFGDVSMGWAGGHSSRSLGRRRVCY